MKLLEVLLKLYIPVLTYSILMDNTPLIASICYFGLTTCMNFKDILNGFVLPICSLIGFFTYIVISIWIPNFRHHPWMVSSALTCLASFASLIRKEPFTIQYARRSVPKEKWNHPVFYRVNWILSSVWTAYFLALFTENIVSIRLHKSFAGILTPLLATAIIFTMKYPTYYRKRHGVTSLK